MKIGVTGGIGSGKSLVVNTLEKLGAVVYHADVRAKELVYLPKIREQIENLLGTEAFRDNIYQTKYVGSIVFQDEETLLRLNNIIHPAVFEDLAVFCEIHRNKIIVYESALMIETGHTHLFDKVILVVAPLELKIERVMKRDSLDRESVLLRMKRQWADEEKLPFADIVIENIDKMKTIARVETLWETNFHS